MIRARAFLAALAVTLAAALAACTGSSEPVVTRDIRLVVIGRVAVPDAAVPGPSNGTACDPALFASEGTPSEGVILLSTTTLANSAAQGFDQRCARVKAVSTAPNAPADVQTAGSGDSTLVLVSVPAAGAVNAYDVTLNPSGPALTLPASAGPFCPTRVSVSPDQTRAAVLDDCFPLDVNPAPGRAPRVVLFDLATRAVLAVIARPFDTQVNRSLGPVTVALTNDALFVLAPGLTTASGYALYRYDPNANRADLEASSGTVVRNYPPDALPSNGLISALDLTPSGSNLLLSFATQLNAGGVLVVNPAANGPDQGLSVGTRSFAPTTNPVTQVVLSNGAADTTAILRPTVVTLARGAVPVDVPVAFATGLAFTPDGFAWPLTATTLSRVDLFALAGNPNPTTFAGLNLQNARGVVTVLAPTP